MKKIFALAAVLLLSVMLLTSCGGSAKDLTAYPAQGVDSFDWDYEEAEAAESGWSTNSSFDGVAVETPAEVEAPKPADEGSETQAADAGRKIIKNGSLEIETLDFDRFISDLEADIAGFGGYVERSSQRGNTYYSGSSRTASYTVRVPSERYDDFVSRVGELGTVTDINEYIDDVTLEYVDVEARLAALKAERDSFMALLDRAETIEDILSIQSYLTDVNYQIESYTSRLNTLKNLVTYSTVNLTVYEVERVTPAEPKNVWQRIASNLEDNLYSIGVSFTNFFVAVVSSLPYILVYAVIIGVIVLVVLVIVKSTGARRRKKREEALRGYPQPNPPQNPQNNGDGK